MTGYKKELVMVGDKYFGSAVSSKQTIQSEILQKMIGRPRVFTIRSRVDGKPKDVAGIIKNLKEHLAARKTSNRLAGNLTMSDLG